MMKNIKSTDAAIWTQRFRTVQNGRFFPVEISGTAPVLGNCSVPVAILSLLAAAPADVCDADKQLWLQRITLYRAIKGLPEIG
jgi:hypothetical protein